MKSKSKSLLVIALMLILFVTACGGNKEPASNAASASWSAAAVAYDPAVALKEGSQAAFDKLAYKPGDKPKIAYMPPATEFNYYMAIGEGIKVLGEKAGVDTFMLAPQSGADINGQMGMLQDVINQNVAAIILSTHDENAAAPLVKQATDKGIMVIIVNSDIANFPTPVHGVVGYKQRSGTEKIGKYLLDTLKISKGNVGILEGQPGYHSTERVGGFTDAMKGSNLKVVSSLNGNWNTEGGNTASMDMLQANPDIKVIFAANDYMIMGAQKAVAALGNKDIVLLGNDGDTAALEEVLTGNVTATVNTSPYAMGEIALSVVLDGLGGKFKGGFVETPVDIVDKNNVLPILQKPEMLYPKPSKKY